MTIELTEEKVAAMIAAAIEAHDNDASHVHAARGKWSIDNPFWSTPEGRALQVELFPAYIS